MLLRTVSQFSFVFALVVEAVMLLYSCQPWVLSLPRRCSACRVPLLRLMVVCSGNSDAQWAYWSCSYLSLSFVVCVSFLLCVICSFPAVFEPLLTRLLLSLVFLRRALSSSIQPSCSNMFLVGTHVPGMLQYFMKSVVSPSVLSSTALS